MPIPTSKPFQKQTAKDKAYQQIKEWIVNGTLMPDEKLAEVELAKSIAVSRTPIREALLRLNEEGLVVITAGKITRVAQIDADNIADLFEPMAVIEGLAANQAASKIDEAEFKKLATLEKKYRVSLNSNKLINILKADRIFHQQILAIADNAYETKFSDQLYSHIYRYELAMIKMLDADHQNFKITANHEALLKALAEQNPVKASATMTKDWLSTLQKIVSIQELTESQK
ncbi:GntR family transcriptional regulator [Companilactobacillus furfuricola]|uniref:GntR family transcriptional regulator n=1 Tax=Companilactobacillus furfuricola TaxID=1462575 RepID=UPI0013DE1142|nr:GntR family transcriptional regulator [Companilactobacillus furfuricola]